MSDFVPKDVTSPLVETDSNVGKVLSATLISPLYLIPLLRLLLKKRLRGELCQIVRRQKRVER